jgi:hypothetical protein
MSKAVWTTLDDLLTGRVRVTPLLAVAAQIEGSA